MNGNMKCEFDKFDFKVFGQAIRAARKAKEISRKQLADQMLIALGKIYAAQTT